MVAVVEATKRSGSLITARQAAEAGRDVLAVPGHPMQSSSQGCLQLLRQGAGMLTRSEELLQASGLESPATGRPGTLPANTSGVFAAINPEADFEHIAKRTGLCTADVAKALMALEIAGLIRMLPGDRYSRVDA